MNEIAQEYTTGSSLYHCRWDSDGDVFLTSGASSEVWGTDGRGASDYAVTMAENAPDGHFIGTFDASGNITISGVYKVAVFLRSGGSPADSDFSLSQGEMYWSGESEVTPLTLSAQSSRVLNKYPTRSQPDV